MKRKPTLRERGLLPRNEIARAMLTSGHFRSNQVPNKKRRADRLACRQRPEEG